MTAPLPNPLAKLSAFHSKQAFDERISRRRRERKTPEAFAAFYHVACMGNWKEVVAEQCETFRAVGITPKAFVLGSAEDVQWLESMPLEIIGSSSNLWEFETPTLEALWEWCKANPDAAVLYLHTKGVSKPDDAHRVAWRKLMMGHLVEPLWENLPLLAVNDLLGVNWQNCPDHPHYSGNFWMARSDWVNSLDSPRSYRNKGGPIIADQPWARMHAEMWIGSMPFHLKESLGCEDRWMLAGRDVFRLLDKLLRKKEDDRIIGMWLAEQAGTVLDLRTAASPPPVHQITADTIVLSGLLEALCNRPAERLLLEINRAPWKRLIVSTLAGVKPKTRRPDIRGRPLPFDIEGSGLIDGIPSRRIPRTKGEFLVYER